MEIKYSDFKNLLVWQRSINLVKTLYKFTKQLPEDEKFRLIDQIKRAARGSCGEIETQLILCQELEFGDFREINDYIREVREINSMIRSLKYSISKT
ncbi:MAG: four helix bundle protein [Muribaculaceae bacterium]|nr:four helix bundle protein [Muribaculaceae bacterium]